MVFSRTSGSRTARAVRMSPSSATRSPVRSMGGTSSAKRAASPSSSRSDPGGDHRPHGGAGDHVGKHPALHSALTTPGDRNRGSHRHSTARRTGRSCETRGSPPAAFGVVEPESASPPDPRSASRRHRGNSRCASCPEGCVHRAPGRSNRPGCDAGIEMIDGRSMSPSLSRLRFSSCSRMSSSW